jgi:hypothetical protein
MAPRIEKQGSMQQWFSTRTVPAPAAIALVVFLSSQLTSLAQGLLLNEIMTSNTHTLLDENGDSPDWIEIHNPGSTSASLAGYGLSDDPALPFKWTFRDVIVPPKGFLLVFASGKDRQPALVAPTNPPAIPGLKVWLRADAVATNDPAQVRASGGDFFVRNWIDQSGTANSAQQTIDDLQPRCRPAVV